MSDLALDPTTGDLLLEAGRARLCTGAEAVAQSWACHLTLFKGECFLDPSLGIDYPNQVLIKNPRPQVLRAIFARETLATPGIKDIATLRFSLNRATRVLTIVAAVTLQDGTETELVLEENVGGL